MLVVSWSLTSQTHSIPLTQVEYLYFLVVIQREYLHSWSSGTRVQEEGRKDIVHFLCLSPDTYYAEDYLQVSSYPHRDFTISMYTSMYIGEIIRMSGSQARVGGCYIL